MYLGHVVLALVRYIAKIPFCYLSQMVDQAVKYLEDMQDDFDFRFKTLQSRGGLTVHLQL